MRVVDIIGSTLGLIFLTPLFLVVAGLIKLTSPGPVFYRALRTGKDGQPFHLYKFRSMQVNADKQGPKVTAADDPRITPLGRLLRRTKLDELPQLINVVKGEMSLVGPRPEDPRYADFYTPEQRQILNVRPGIVSAATMAYRYEEQILSVANTENIYLDKVMPAKLVIDLDYISRRTLWTDIGLIFQAIVSMVTPSQQFFSLILGDILGILLAFLFALILRFDGDIPAESWQFFFVAIPFIILLYCIANIPFGLYSHIWRYTSANEIISIINSTATSTFFLLVVILIRDTKRPMPLSMVVFGGILTTLAFMMVRYRERLVTGLIRRLHRIVGRPERQQMLIVGAGEAGQFLAQQMQSGGQHPQYEVVGFVDDNPRKLGMWIQSVPILGPCYSIPALVKERNVSLIVIAIHNISGPELRNILSICMTTQVRVNIMPDILGNVDSRNGIVPLENITPEDLLGREPYQVDEAACRELVTNKVVLITGAAGSIGSELCHQILNFQPRQLLVLDNNETGLYDLTTVFEHSQLTHSKPEHNAQNIIPLVADVTNQNKMKKIFQTYHPQLVFHAAAYKHVPMMEHHPDEAVRVNVSGTKLMAELSARHHVERFVLISSDKAIKPTSIMGATKRAGEMIITNDSPMTHNGHGNTSSPTTYFTAVRFGNVLGSRGSVVSTFTRQIELGGPVTITHPEMNRYFMSLGEAVSLVIQAATLTQGGDLFMLDMGQEIRIVDLAYKMIRLRGLRPKKDIPIEFSGIRPGEKLHEDLLSPDEERLPTTHPKIFRIRNNRPQLNGSILTEQISYLIELANNQHHREARKALWQLVRPELAPLPIIATHQNGNSHLQAKPESNGFKNRINCE
jgi:FlaA1/EpsC-like NDP-sugar epimerase/lipopolysaccharide/colanic/teichoic acid biosynthesis glycosyltransferase